MINLFVIFMAILIGCLFGYIYFLIKQHGLYIPQIKIFWFKFFGNQIVVNPKKRINEVLNDPELLYKKLKESGTTYLNHGHEFKISLVDDEETGKKRVQIEESPTMKKIIKQEQGETKETKNEKRKKDNSKKSKKANKRSKNKKV